MTVTTDNSLKSFIAVKRAEMTAEKGGAKVLIKDVEQDLARHCGVTWDTIKMIKRGVNQPSLSVAMLIAKYFRVRVEDIFELEVKSD